MDDIINDEKSKDIKKIGRPFQEIKRDDYLKIRVTSDLKNRLRDYAKKSNFTMSQVTEMAIESFIFEDF
ncbi:hypothetical protein JHD50_07805 [Sulfurimonas sp. MAG313]|nr:hypothetical protein [Sulfurimonas sp. MAG313]MDF1881207.1 hypothetical protein [Sulfurimonas sp. MAG313]